MDSCVLEHLKNLFNEYQIKEFNCSIFNERDSGNIYQISLNTETGYWIFYTYCDQIVNSQEFYNVEWRIIKTNS